MELVAGAPARHLRFQNELLPIFMSVTNEHARQICFQSGISSRRALLAGEGARATRVGESFDFAQASSTPIQRAANQVSAINVEKVLATSSRLLRHLPPCPASH